MSLQRKRSRARKRLQTADMSVFTSLPSSVWGTNKNKKNKKEEKSVMAMRLLVSVVVHCGCDGHASPDLSPTNQTARKTERESYTSGGVFWHCSQKHLCKHHTHLRPHSYRQCFSTRLLRAIFSPTSVHTGLVSTILARSALTALTRPPVDSEPMFTISTSFLDSFWTCRSGRQSGC